MDFVYEIFLEYVPVTVAVILSWIYWILTHYDPTGTDYFVMPGNPNDPRSYEGRHLRRE